MAKHHFMGIWLAAAVAISGIVSIAFATAPFVTVPWNGYSGAASFTFDDALEDQVKQLTPMLSELPDAKVTFFLTNAGMDLLYKSAAGFANLAKMGNEMGNHTNSHKMLSELDESSIRTEILDFASEIEKVMAENGAEVNITSHAPPFCDANKEVVKVVEERHFISRGGGWHGRHRWDIEPQWSFIDAKVWYSFPNYIENILASLDTAAYVGDYSNAKPWEMHAHGASWIVLLFHGINNNGGTSISPKDLRKAFKHAISNNMWVAPFSTVGAYLRAHFTLDTANAVSEGDKYSVQWELPHSNMPQSIPMKVTLNESFKAKTFGINTHLILEQNGKIIYPDDNGIYTIEFTEQKVTIRKANTAKIFKIAKLKENTSTSKSTHSPNGASNSLTTYTIFDLKGNKLGTTKTFEVPYSMPKGIYLIQEKTPGHSAVIKRIAR